MFIYVVKPGDTLWQLSVDYRISLQSIIITNDLYYPNQLIEGQALVMPKNDLSKHKPVIDVNGYLYFLGRQSISIVEEYGRYLTYLTPFSYLIEDDGSLRLIEDNPALDTAFEQSVYPMMCITNSITSELGQNSIHDVLSNSAIVLNLINNIISIAREKGYNGLNIYFVGIDLDDRELFNQFLELITDRLHSEGFFVSTTIAPKTSATQVNLLYEAYDYPAHGSIVDFVIIRTYDWGYALGPPRPISPVNEIRKVLDYAVSVIPNKKIFFGFQIYGRDWLISHVPGQEAETISCQEALNRAIMYETVIQYDTASQAPFYRYTDEMGRRHEVWFEDARITQAKFDIVKEYDLRGISYWALGLP